jgi:hypothetical protein
MGQKKRIHTYAHDRTEKCKPSAIQLFKGQNGEKPVKARGK